MRGTRLSLLAGLALLLLGAAPLQAAPRAEERCASRMAEASGRYLDCAMRENGRAAKHRRAANLDRCERKLGRMTAGALRRWGPAVCPSVNQVGGEATTLGDQLNGLVSQMSEAVGVSGEGLSDDAALCAAQKAKVLGQDLRCRARALARAARWDRPLNEEACSERRLARKLARIEKKYGVACPGEGDAGTLATREKLALSEVTDWVAPSMQRYAVAVDPPALQTLPDADGDGLSDNFEIGLSLTDPERPDSDGDGRWDGLEVLHHGTDPLVADSDPEAPTKYKRPHSEGANLDHVYPGAWNSRIAGIPMMWDPESVYGNTVIGVASSWIQIICTFGNCSSPAKPTPTWATKGFAKVENGIAAIGKQIKTLGSDMQKFDDDITKHVAINQQLLEALRLTQLDNLCRSAKTDFAHWTEMSGRHKATSAASPRWIGKAVPHLNQLQQNMQDAFGTTQESTGARVEGFFYDYQLSPNGTPKFRVAEQLGNGYRVGTGECNVPPRTFRCHIEKIRQACHREAVYEKLVDAEANDLGADRIYGDVMKQYLREEFGSFQQALLFHATSLRAQAWFHAGPELRRTAFWMAMQEQKVATHTKLLDEPLCSVTHRPCSDDQHCDGANDKCVTDSVKPNPLTHSNPCPSHLRLMGTQEHGRCVAAVSRGTCSAPPHARCDLDDDCSGHPNVCVLEDVWQHTTTSSSSQRTFTHPELVAGRTWRAVGSICEAWALEQGKPCDSLKTDHTKPGLYCQALLCEPTRSHCEEDGVGHGSLLCLTWRAGRNSINAGLSVGEAFTNKTYTYEPTRGVLWLQDPVHDSYVRHKPCEADSNLFLDCKNEHEGENPSPRAARWAYLTGHPGQYQFRRICPAVLSASECAGFSSFTDPTTEAIVGGWPNSNNNSLEFLRLKPATRPDWMGGAKALFITNQDGMMSAALSGGAGNAQNNRRASFAPHMAQGMYQKGNLAWPSYSKDHRPFAQAQDCSDPKTNCTLRPAVPAITHPTGGDEGDLACAAGWRTPDLLWMGSYLSHFQPLWTPISESWGYRWNTDASRTALGECRTTAAQYFMYPHLRIEHEYSMSDVAYAVGKNDTFCGSEACDQNYADKEYSPTTLKYGAWPGAPSYEGDNRASIKFGLSCNWLTHDSRLQQCELAWSQTSQPWDGRACNQPGVAQHRPRHPPSNWERSWRHRTPDENSLSFEVDSACNHRHDILSWVHSSSDFRKTTLTIGQDSCKWPPSFGYTWLGDYQVPHGSYDAFDIRCRSMDGGNGLNSVWGLTKRDTCLLPIINSGASLPLTHSTEFISHPVQPPCCSPDRCDSSDCWGIALPVACADSAKAGKGCDGRGSTTYETFGQCLNFSDAPNCAHLGVQSPYLMYGDSQLPFSRRLTSLVTPGGVASQVEMIASYATNALLRDGVCGATPATPWGASAAPNPNFLRASDTPFLKSQPAGPLGTNPTQPLSMWPTIDLLSPAGPDLICPGAQDWTDAHWTEKENPSSSVLKNPVSEPPETPVTTFHDCVEKVTYNLNHLKGELPHHQQLEPHCDIPGPTGGGTHWDEEAANHALAWCHKSEVRADEEAAKHCRKTCSWIDRCQEAKFIADSWGAYVRVIVSEDGTRFTEEELYTRVVRKSASAFQATKALPSSCCSNAMCENNYTAALAPLVPSVQAGWKQPQSENPDHICTQGNPSSWANPGRVYQKAKVYKVDGVQECVSQCGSDCKAIHYNATWCTVFEKCDHTVPYPYGGTLYRGTTLAKMKAEVADSSKPITGNQRATPPGAMYGNRVCMCKSATGCPGPGDPTAPHRQFTNHYSKSFTQCATTCREDPGCYFFSYIGAHMSGAPQALSGASPPNATSYGEAHTCTLYNHKSFFYHSADVSLCGASDFPETTWVDAPEGWAVWAKPVMSTWGQDPLWTWDTNTWACTRPGSKVAPKHCSLDVTDGEIDAFLNLGLLSVKPTGN